MRVRGQDQPGGHITRRERRAAGFDLYPYTEDAIRAYEVAYAARGGD